MNRRGFFKVLTSLVTGAYLAFVPKAKGLTMEALLGCKKELEKAERRSGTEFIAEFLCEVRCNRTKPHILQDLTNLNNGMVIFCENGVIKAKRVKDGS